MSEIKRNIYIELLNPFSIDDYSIDKSRGFPLTSLKAQSIKQRLNEVFGIFGWCFKESFIEKPEGIICHGKLLVRNPEDSTEIREVEATGGCEFKDKAQTLSDAYKSAATEALSKASSYIGIGNEMYKGNISTDYIALDRGNFDAAKNAIKASKTKEQLEKVKLQLEQRKWDESEIKELKDLINKKEI
jgi:hypothetical protein